MTMPVDRRCKNYTWWIKNEDNQQYNDNSPLMAVLQDIRDELQEANQRLRFIAVRINCRETLTIPALLRAIKNNTTKKRSVAKKRRKA